MRIHELDLPAKRQSGRKGRGISAGQGKTAGRGTKGQNSRTGGGVRPGFEGGQNPLSARLPKLAGFKSRRVQKQTVTTGQLANVKAKTIDNSVLAESGIVQRKDMSVKVVLKGDLGSAKTVKLQSASQEAATAIAKAGGKFIKTAAPKAARAGADKPEEKS